MKNILLTGLILGLFFTIDTNEVSAASTQQITLRTGWNIISTPKVLESHSFSAAETSDNFDIFLLDPSKSSGWATMNDLGHNTFVPLYGYFIQNKTGSNQTLTLTQSDNVNVNDRLFDRRFTHTGWHSIGIANPSYAIKQHSSGSPDINNPSRILNALSGNYDSVIDVTSGESSDVSVSNQWQAAVANDVNLLKDFRETKGYAIYITNANSVYTGYQNNSSTTTESVLLVESVSSTPAEKMLRVKETSTSDDFHVKTFRLKTGSQSDDIKVSKIVVDINFSNPTTTATSTINDIWLKVGSKTYRDYTLASTSASFDIDNNDLIISGNDSVNIEIYTKFNRLNGNYQNETGVTFMVNGDNIVAKDMNNNDIVATGSSAGKMMMLSISTATINAFTWKVTKASSGNSGAITFRFTVEAEDEDFTLRHDSLVAITTGTATSTGPTWSVVSGNATSVTGGYNINSGDSATFEATFSITGPGTKAVSITSIANRTIPTDKQYSGLEVF